MRGSGELNDSYFLGPPLPLDGHLYGVVEKNQELCLVCLDASGGGLRWKQALVTPLEKLLRDVGRRVHPLRPVYGEGILVCPTDAGVVLGVDLFHRSVAWAYLYREDALPQDGGFNQVRPRGRYGPRELPRLREEWKAAGPFVHGDRIILTAPDASAIHCLDLRSGAPVWKVERKEGDLYVAGVFGGKVLVVGCDGCHALGLANGKRLWAVTTGLPTGLGVASGRVYYLPARSAPPGNQPGVYAIDLEKGTILARTPVPREERGNRVLWGLALGGSGILPLTGRAEVPGNLVLCGDDVLSQTVGTVTAYARRQSDKDQEGDK